MSGLENLVKTEINKTIPRKEPRILLFDIETAPNLAYVWGKYEQDVIDYQSQWYMMTFAYKWLGDKRVHARALPNYPSYKKDKTDDRALVTDLYKLFDAADIIVVHNGDQFDVRKTNARFAVHGLPPPSFYRTVDTKKVAKKYFNFNSNKLDDLGSTLGLGRKDKHNKFQGFDLWLGCMQGDEEAWMEMVKYNKRDVELLEKVYENMRPWMTNHPNVALLSGADYACTACSSDNIQKRGFSYTRVGKFQRYQCMDCYAWSTDRKSLKTEVKVK